MTFKKLPNYFFLIFCLLCSSQIIAQPTYWHTNGVTVGGTVHSGTDATHLSSPTAVFVDASGNKYVADYLNNRVQKFPAGSQELSAATTVAGGNGAGNALNQVTKPEAVWVDGAGNLYVADNNTTNPRVLRFPAGSSSSTMGVICAGGNGQGSGLNQFTKPDGLFMDASGTLYVSDYNDSSRARILKFANAATSTSSTMGAQAGGGCTGNCWHKHGATILADPKGICVDGSGNVYVADAGYNRIVKFTSPTSGSVVAGSPAATQGAGVTVIDSLLWAPYDVKLDAHGNMIISNNGAARIVEWTTGASTCFWVAANGPIGIAPNSLGQPAGIYIDNNTPQALYVADEGNFRIQKFNDTTAAVDAGVQQLSALLSQPELFPNPNNGSFTIKTNVDASLEGKDAYIQVVNTLGQIVAGDKTIVLNGTIQKTMNLNHSLPQGVYQLYITCANQYTVSKLEIVK